MNEPRKDDDNVIETSHKIGDNNIEGRVGPFGFDIHNPVFVVSGLSVVAFVFYALAFKEQASDFFSWLRPALTSNLDWFFLISANIFVLFCLVLIFTPFGAVRLGGRDATPDFSYPSWFAMLFAAGMGIGLMYFGVLEPAYHMAVSEPLGVPKPFDANGGLIEENVTEARNMGIAATIYHWGLHPWAIYAVVGLSLALFSYNKGLPFTIRSAFYPIFGEAVWGWVGHVIDIIAVFATLFGLATSLGLGAMQAGAGLDHIYGVTNTTTLQIILITVITLIAIVSVVRGLDGGVRILSEVNMALAAILLLFVIVMVGIGVVLTDFFVGLFTYAKTIVPLSNPFGRTDTGYSQGWTAFYWAWWISWSPFVGMFIARVSRGRTVREFLIAVLIVPSLVCVLWMAAFGGGAIEQIIADMGSVKQAVLGYKPEISLFALLGNLPLATITSTIGIILVVVFFVTSSDSGSLVVDTITAGGKVDAPVSQRVFWCTFEGAVAIVLLIGGGLTALQAMVISTGGPFTVILLLMCLTIVMGLKTEQR